VTLSDRTQVVGVRQNKFNCANISDFQIISLDVHLVLVACNIFNNAAP